MKWFSFLSYLRNRFKKYIVDVLNQCYLSVVRGLAFCLVTLEERPKDFKRTPTFSNGLGNFFFMMC